MTETVYALVLRDEEDIWRFQLYKHKDSCKEAKAEIEHSGLWSGPDQSVECEPKPVIRSEPHGWVDDDSGDVDLGGTRGP